jgi:hypothetical protein
MSKHQGVTVKAPLDLMALLATMKSAKAQGVSMAIWDKDIKAIENAIATINAIRSLPPSEGAKTP